MGIRSLLCFWHHVCFLGPKKDNKSTLGQDFSSDYHHLVQKSLCLHGGGGGDLILFILGCLVVSLASLDASSMPYPSSYDNQEYFRHCQMPSEVKSSWTGNDCPKSEQDNSLFPTSSFSLHCSGGEDLFGFA